MLDFVICASTNLFRMYVIYRFLFIFFEDKMVNKKVEVLAYLGFYVVNTSLFWIFHTAWINILCNLLCISIIVFLYVKSLKTILFVTTSIYVILMACDIAATTLFVDYQDGEAHSQVCAVIAVFFMFICEVIAEKVIAARRNSEADQKFPIILVPISSIIILWILIYSDTCEGVGIAIVSLGLLGINFLMLYLYNLLVNSLVEEYETELLQQQIRIYANQLEAIMKSEEKVKGLRHDIKHHLNEIKVLANQCGSVEIQNYVDQMQQFLHNDHEIVASGNMEIDSVLNYMLYRAKTELKNVTSKIMIPEGMKHYFDINILIGNLLENAIEAARQTEEKELFISIVFAKGVLKIVVENSFDEKYSANRKAGKSSILWETTKREKERHGIGLKNVKKIVEAYHGIILTEVHDKLFCVKMALYMMDVES